MPADKLVPVTVEFIRSTVVYEGRPADPTPPNPVPTNTPHR